MENTNNIVISVPGENGIPVQVLFCLMGSQVYMSCASNEFKKVFGDFVIKVSLHSLDRTFTDISGKGRFRTELVKSFRELQVNARLLNCYSNQLRSVVLKK